MEISFIVDGPPRGKQRPRFARRGKYTTTYTPKETVDYERYVIDCFNSQITNTYLCGPLEVDITAIFPIPKSYSKKKKAELINNPHTKKPDCDNVAKIILDALNKIVFYDDSQVSRLIVTKLYGDEPRVEVRLKELWQREKINPNSPLFRFKTNTILEKE